jgi:hypothetical protein
VIFVVISVTLVLLVLVVLWRAGSVRGRRTNERYVPVAAWRAAQGTAEIRAAASMVRRQLRDELDELDLREREVEGGGKA